MARPASKEPKTRLNLEVPERVRERFDRLHVESEAESLTEVIRRPLAVYDVLLRPAPRCQPLELFVVRLYANPFPRLSGVPVLIADDDPDTLAMLASVLRRCGAEVSTATSAAEALKVPEASEPSLLVVDIGMPGEDGYSLIRKVRDLLPRKIGRTPALALTAYARTEDRVRALAAGYKMHVPKPIESIELAAAVKCLAAGFMSWSRDE
jgi:CheY-like chemotaxis protein